MQKDMTKRCEEFSQKVSNVEKMFEEMSSEKKFLLELDKEKYMGDDNEVLQDFRRRFN